MSCSEAGKRSNLELLGRTREEGRLPYLTFPHRSGQLPHGGATPKPGTEAFRASISRGAEGGGGSGLGRAERGHDCPARAQGVDARKEAAATQRCGQQTSLWDMDMGGFSTGLGQREARCAWARGAEGAGAGAFRITIQPLLGEFGSGSAHGKDLPLCNHGMCTTPLGLQGRPSLAAECTHHGAFDCSEVHQARHALQRVQNHPLSNRETFTSSGGHMAKGMELGKVDLTCHSLLMPQLRPAHLQPKPSQRQASLAKLLSSTVVQQHQWQTVKNFTRHSQSMHGPHQSLQGESYPITIRPIQIGLDSSQGLQHAHPSEPTVHHQPPNPPDIMKRDTADNVATLENDIFKLVDVVEQKMKKSKADISWPEGTHLDDDYEHKKFRKYSPQCSLAVDASLDNSLEHLIDSALAEDGATNNRDQTSIKSTDQISKDTTVPQCSSSGRGAKMTELAARHRASWLRYSCSEETMQNYVDRFVRGTRRLSEDMLHDAMTRMFRRWADFVQGEEIVGCLSPDARQHLLELRLPDYLAFCLADYLSLADDDTLGQLTFDFGDDNHRFWNDCLSLFVRLDEGRADTLEGLLLLLKGDLGMEEEEEEEEEVEGDRLCDLIGGMACELAGMGGGSGGGGGPRACLPLLILLNGGDGDGCVTALDRLLMQNMFDYDLAVAEEAAVAAADLSRSWASAASAVEGLTKGCEEAAGLLLRACPKVRRALKRTLTDVRSSSSFSSSSYSNSSSSSSSSSSTQQRQHQHGGEGETLRQFMEVFREKGGSFSINLTIKVQPFPPSSKVQSSEFQVQGSGFSIQSSKFRVQSSELKVQSSMFRVQGSDFRVQSSEFRVQGSEIRV